MVIRRIDKGVPACKNIHVIPLTSSMWKWYKNERMIT